MRLPPLSSLRAFEAAVRHGGFARAAEELSLTPNAVAHQVKQLEAWLDVRLFDRHARGVLPTSAGRDYAASIGELFTQLETATRALKSRHDDRVVTVTAIPSFVSRWLMPRLTTLAERHPEVEVRVLAGVRPVDVARGEADVAIRLGPGHYPGLAAEVLIEEDFVAVASSAFLADRAPLRHPAELVERRVPLLHDEMVPEIPAQIDWARWLRAVGVTPPARLHGHLFSHTYLTLEAAMAGQGVAIASHASLGDAVRAGLLTVLFDGLSVRGPYRYHLLTRPGAEERPAVAAVCAWLREEAASAR